MRPLLEVVDLSYARPNGVQALKGVSLQVSVGETLIIFGPNGSGKTTLLLHLNGTLRGKGVIRVADMEVNAANLNEIRRRVGIVFQNADEQLFMPSVLEDVMYGPQNLGLSAAEAEERARECLQRVSIPVSLFERPPYHLSAGEKRRVALAGVLAMQPDLLLLDEPTTSLDPPGQRSLCELLKELNQTKIIATHDVHFGRSLGSRAVFLQEGRVAGDGTVDEIAGRFGWGLY